MKPMKMKTRMFVAARVLAALSLLVSCAADLETRRTRAGAIRKVGEAYMASRDYTSALGEFLKARDLFPDDHALLNDMGLVYMAKNRLESAEASFKRALSLKPDYAEALNNLGSVYLAMKKWDAAIAAIGRVADSLVYATPHYPLANLGWAHYNKKNYAQAVIHYQKALKLAPGFAMALRDLGRTYMAMGKTPQAAAVLSKGVGAAPQSAEMAFYLAKALAASGDDEGAARHFDRALRLWPGCPCAPEAQSEISRIGKKVK
jgi:type IV pilus assembly protein PilF